MALDKFTKAILAGDPIDVYNNGEMSRDFTYIDDIVEGVLRVLKYVPKKLEPTSSAPYRICNLGRNEPVSLSRFIESIELATEKKAIRNNMPMQQGDVQRTYADVSKLKTLTGYSPKTDLDEGVDKFVAWYKQYHLKES